MPEFLDKLTTPGDALQLFRTYPLDVGSVSGYGLTRGTAFNWATSQKWQNVKKSAVASTIIPTDEAVCSARFSRKTAFQGFANGGPGSLGVQLGEKDEYNDGINVHFLPWDERGGIVSTGIPEFGNDDDADDNPFIFLTAALSGCSVFFKGSERAPTVVHAGTNVGNVPYDAKKFWREFVEELDAQNPVVGEVNKTHYVVGRRPERQLQRNVQSQGYVRARGISVGRGRKKKHVNEFHPYAMETTNRANQFLSDLRTYYRKKGILILNARPWGAVMGLRGNDRRWKFFLQENVNLQYYPLTLLQRINKLLGKYNQNPETWAHLAANPRAVSRVMFVSEVFPGGQGRAELHPQFHCLLKPTQLVTAPFAQPIV